MNSVNKFNRKAHENSPTAGQLTRSFCALVAGFLLATHVMAEEPKRDPAADEAAFEKAVASAAWAEMFSDDCTEDWHSGVVTIQFGDKKRVLDFNENHKQ